LDKQLSQCLPIQALVARLNGMVLVQAE